MIKNSILKACDRSGVEVTKDCFELLNLECLGRESRDLLTGVLGSYTRN